MSGSLVICTPYYVAVPPGGGISAPGIGWFIGGAWKANTYKYTFDVDTLTASTSLTDEKFQGVAIGNTEHAIADSGRNSTGAFTDARDKYTYVDESIIAVTGSGLARRYQHSFGNDVVGFIACGVTGTTAGTETNAVHKYTYSTGGNVTATAAINDVFLAAGCSSPTVGYSFGGYLNSANYSSINQYVYSTEVNSGTGSVLSTPRRGGFAASTSSVGYLFGGIASSHVDLIDKYDMSANINTQLSSTLNTAIAYTAAMGDIASAVIAGGDSAVGSLNAVDKFSYATETVAVTGYTLADITAYSQGSSSSHGGLQ